MRSDSVQIWVDAKTTCESKNTLLFSCFPFRVPPSESFRKFSSLLQVDEALFDEVWLLRVDCPECFQKVTFLGCGVNQGRKKGVNQDVVQRLFVQWRGLASYFAEWRKCESWQYQPTRWKETRLGKCMETNFNLPGKWNSLMDSFEDFGGQK